MLGPRVLSLDDNSSRDMRDAHRAVRGVDVLTASAARAIGVNPAVAFVHRDIDGVVDNGIDPDRRKACVPARVGIVRRYAHEAMNARFRLEPAISVLPLDLDRRRL